MKMEATPKLNTATMIWLVFTRYVIQGFNEIISFLFSSKAVPNSNKNKTEETTDIQDHSSARILCPLIDCDFEAKRMYKIQQHWHKAHPNLRFPVIRDKAPYTYETAKFQVESPSHVCVLYLFTKNILYFIFYNSCFWIFIAISAQKIRRTKNQQVQGLQLQIKDIIRSE